MVRVSEIYSSGGRGGQFLNAKICDEKGLWGKELTIVDIEERELNDRVKLVVHFKEIDNTLVLNRTNALILADAFGDDTNMWDGQKITLKKVKRSFQGKLVDAIEVEAIKQETIDMTAEGKKKKKSSKK